MTVRRGIGNVRLTIIVLVFAMVAVVLTSGCGSSSSQEPPANTDAANAATGEQAREDQVRIMLLDCPGSMGLCSFVQNVEEGEYERDYRIATCGDSVSIEEAFETGDVDIALTYPVSSSDIYVQTEGSVSVVAISSLVDSAVMTANKTIKDFDDLKDRTIYTTNPNAPYTFVLTKLLDAAMLSDGITIEYLANEAEVVATLNKSRSAAGVLTEPARSAATVYNRKVHDVVTLTDLWGEYIQDGSLPVNSVIIVRKEFYEAHPDTVKEFLEEARKSVDEVTKDPYTYASKASELGFSESDVFAEASIPRSELVCITGEEMRTALFGYLQALREIRGSLFDGAEPPEDFFLTVEGLSEEEGEASSTVVASDKENDKAESKKRDKEAAKAEALADVADATKADKAD